MVRRAAKKKTTTTKAAPKKLKMVKASEERTPKVGGKAPAFKMPATDVGYVSSAGLKGKAFVLYFYPKDDTSGCTVEACDFRNAIPQLGKLGITIIGVSKDSLASHEKFKKKYNLNFPLASDEAGNICASYGTWVQKSMYGRKYMGIERSTFLIDNKGVVRALWRKVSVPGHVEEVKKAIKEL